MTRIRVLFVLAVGGLFLMLGTPAGQAAPGDPITFADVPPGCYVYGLPPGQTVYCPPSAGGPAQPVYHSICTPIDNSAVAPLLRKSCQRFDQNNNPVGDPQIYVYAPENNLTPPPTPTDAPASTVTPRTTSAPPAPAPVVVTRVVPGPTRTETKTVEVAAATEPAPTMTESTTPAGPTTQNSAAPPDLTGLGDHSSPQSVSDGVLYGIAAVAALVLLGVTVIPALLRRFKGGAHRA